MGVHIGKAFLASLRDCRKFGGVITKRGYFRVCSLTGGGRVAWIMRLVQIGAEGEGQATDIIRVTAQ